MLKHELRYEKYERYADYVKEQADIEFNQIRKVQALAFNTLGYPGVVQAEERDLDHSGDHTSGKTEFREERGAYRIDEVNSDRTNNNWPIPEQISTSADYRITVDAGGCSEYVLWIRHSGLFSSSLR